MIGATSSSSTPIDQGRIRSTSPYGNLCGIHGLTHCLHYYLHNEAFLQNIRPEIRQELVNGFITAHKIPPALSSRINWDYLVRQFKGLNPIQRELALSPALAEMIGSAQRQTERSPAGVWPMLTSEDVRRVANKFNIRVASFGGPATQEAQTRYFSQAIGVKPNPAVDGIIPDSDELAGINQQIQAGVRACFLRLQHTDHAHWEYEDPDPRHQSVNIEAYNKLYENFNYNYAYDAPILATAIRDTCGQPLDVAVRLFERRRAGGNANPDVNLYFSNKSSFQSTIKNELNTWFDMLKDAMVALTETLRDLKSKSIFENFLAALKDFLDTLTKVFDSNLSSASTGRKHQAEAEAQESQTQSPVSASRELQVRAANVRSRFPTSGPQNDPQQPKQNRSLQWTPKVANIEIVEDDKPTGPTTSPRPLT